MRLILETWRYFYNCQQNEDPNATTEDVKESESEERLLGEETMQEDSLNIAESGPTLSQAEVEAGLKTVCDGFLPLAF